MRRVPEHDALFEWPLGGDDMNLWNGEPECAGAGDDQNGNRNGNSAMGVAAEDHLAEERQEYH
jgi:hypothetical protein